eukprot:522879-Amphidinium_carterae.1
MGICSKNTCGPGVLASPTLSPEVDLYLDQRVVSWRKLKPCADAGEFGYDGLTCGTFVTPPGRVVNSVVSGASSSEVVAVSTSWISTPSGRRGSVRPSGSTALAD